MKKKLGFGLVLVGFVLVSVACSSTPSTDATVVVNESSFDQNAYGALVQPVFEKTCGSADCHGKLPRGLRIYGQNTGLRLPGATGSTSPNEIEATYESILGLEPEKLNDFVSTQPRSTDAAYKLLVLAKPLQLERHRGGISLRKGEPAEQCILSWLMGQADATACSK